MSFSLQSVSASLKTTVVDYFALTTLDSAVGLLDSIVSLLDSAVDLIDSTMDLLVSIVCLRLIEIDL